MAQFPPRRGRVRLPRAGNESGLRFRLLAGRRRQAKKLSETEALLRYRAEFQGVRRRRDVG